MRRVLTSLLAALVVAAAQAPTGRDRARAALPSEVFEQVEQVAAEAAAAGLPVEPLWDKALEGAAKRVPAPRIAPAVTDYAERLRAAQSALGAGHPPGGLVAGADALRRGVPAEALARLAPGREQTPMALLVLADLVETGVPADRAIDVVREALDRRTADEEMLGLAARVRAAMRQGQSAGAAAEGVRRAIREGRVRSAPSDQPVPAPPGAEPVTRTTRGSTRSR